MSFEDPQTGSGPRPHPTDSAATVPCSRRRRPARRPSRAERAETPRRAARVAMGARDHA